ncbi:MAG: DNA-directed RNA polymerase subunit omega [Lachnospiraceae bacterium]|nr:DNA-directed RNA polymerase subunit omega [Lachnospiraceae bacterium]
MLLRPSYGELIDVANEGLEPGEHKVIQSRYSIVIATSKRARQLIDGDEALIKIKTGQKPLSIAVEEIRERKVTILGEDDRKEEEINVE